jgi:erythromycin esterase
VLASALAAVAIVASMNVAPAPSDSSVAAWFARHAVPIDSTGSAFRSLDGVITAARLIGVGESVHGMQEFTSFRIALLQDLVRRHQVTALILESGLPEATAVDDYVHGRVDTVSYATALGGEFGQSELARRALQWLREWNLGAGRAHPVSVFGADVSIGDGRTMLPALDHLAHLVGNDERLAVTLDSIRPIATRINGSWLRAAQQNYQSLPPGDTTRLLDLVSRLVAATRQWTGGTAEQRALAERFALLVEQDIRILRADPHSTGNPRDVGMADNARWLVDRLPRGERAVLWAHNAHVQRVAIKGPVVPAGVVTNMGSRLAEELGSRYVAIGTAYGGPSADSATAPATQSVDALVGTDLHSFPALVVLKGAPKTDEVDAWLRRERPMRFQVGYLTVSLAHAFDALVYFDHVSSMIEAR